MEEASKMKIVRGQTALVTGASRGLGVYIAQALAAKGVNLVLAARSTDALEEVRKKIEAIGVRAIAVPTDVGNRSALERLVRQSADEFGPLDVLVNNAGIERTLAYDSLALDEIEQIVQVNLAAPMLLTRLILPAMLERNRGHIVNIASVAGMLPVAYTEPYVATKFGLVGFTRSLRLTLQEMGAAVSASVVCPGFMNDAGMYENLKKQYGVKAAWFVGSVSPQEVTDAIIRAIEYDLPDVMVTPGAARVLMGLNAVVPWLLEEMAVKPGFSSVLRTTAAHRASERTGKGRLSR
jgi:short-subunit dehydrogenase